jgi:cation:H+ antiporter
MIPLAGFLLCSLIIVISGTRLSKYGDRIANLTGLGKAWIGLIVMASVTSLPELITGISAVTLVNDPDLAAGDIFGSCIFNLFILSVLDAFMKKPITSTVKSSHIIAGAISIILITIAAIGIILQEQIPAIGWISAITPLIGLVYLISIILIHKFEQKNADSSSGEAINKEGSHELRKAILLYALNALIVIVAAIFLPYFGNKIAVQAGISSTFFGTFMVATSTSLPELVVCISALRMGSVDLAVGNLFGSNIFNIFILAVDDAFYTNGSIFSNIDQDHLISILTVIIMTAVTTVGLLFKAATKKFLLATDTFIIFILYLSLMYFLARA